MNIVMYLCPALMDWMVFFVIFAVMFAVGERGFGTGAGSVISALMQVAYMLSSIGTGSILNRRNARTILLSSTLLCGAFSAVCLASQTFWQMLAGVICLGVALGLFFNSFQTFMRNESAPGELKKAVALYTISWSGGGAIGFLSSGYLYAYGKLVMASTVVTVSVVILAILLCIKRRSGDTPTSDDHIEEGSPSAPRVRHSYVLVGWMMFFTMLFVQRALCTFYPLICARDGMASMLDSAPLFVGRIVHAVCAPEGVDSLLASVPLFVQMALQAMFGFYMFKFRDWLYRAGPQMFFHLSAALLFGALWLWPSPWFGMAVLSIVGIYSGFISFCSVYYSSNSGHRSFNIGVNECMVGLGSVAGIFIVEWLIKRSGSENTMYIVCAAALALAALAQAAAPWAVDHARGRMRFLNKIE